MNKEQQSQRMGQRITALRKMEAERRRIGMEIAEARKRCVWVDEAGVMRVGMTQFELGRKVGISQNHISRIEHGMYSSQFDTLEAIAEAVRMRVGVVSAG